MMPVKNTDKLKNSGDRAAANEWKKALNLKEMNTREWNRAAALASSGKNDAQIRMDILGGRRGR